MPTTAWNGGLVVGLSALVVGGIVLALPPVLGLGAIIGFVCLIAVVRFPFLGLYVIVLGSQLGGLIAWAFKDLEDYVLEGVALVTLLGIALNSYREPRSQRFGPDVLAFRFAVLYGAVLVASHLLADNASGVEMDLLKHLALLALLYVIIRLVRTMEQLKMLMVAISLAAAISGSISLIDDLTGRPMLKTDTSPIGAEEPGRHVGASSATATTTSQLMLAGAGIALLLAVRAPRRQKAFFLILAMGGLTGMVLANARSASLVGLFALVWLLFKHRRHRHLPAILLCSLLLGAMALPLIVERQAERFATLSLEEDYTVSRRLGYQLVGLELLASNPLFGVGPGNFRHLYTSYEYRWMPDRTLIRRDLHNMYLSVATESGLLGLACFGGMLGAALLGLARVRRETADPEVAAYAEALQFGYLLFLMVCVVAPATTNKMTWILTGLAAVMPGAALTPKRSEPEPLADGRTLTAALKSLFAAHPSPQATERAGDER